MSEEKSTDPSITNDDVNVLRVLLHNIRGISAVSSVEYTTADDTQKD